MKIKEIGGDNCWLNGPSEGWRAEKIKGTYFAHDIIFDSDQAKIMFLLKYGRGK